MQKTGRPTKYCADMLAKSKQYLNDCKDEYTYVADEGLKQRVIVNFPSIEGLASCLNVNRDTLYTWAEAHQEFSDMLEALKEEQAKRLLNNGLSGTYNPTIAKLVLSRHGYVEKSEKDITSNGKTLAALISEIDD